jgi:hypothetical protein
MTIAYSQTAPLNAGAGASSLATGTFPSQPSIGTYIVVAAWGANVSNHSAGHFTLSGMAITFTQQGFEAVNGSQWCSLWFGRVATASLPNQITLTVASESAGYITIVAAAFTGVASSFPLDGSAVGATGTGQSAAPGNLAFSANDAVFAVMGSNDSASSASVTTPTGFTSVASWTNGSSAEVGQFVYAINPSSPTDPTWAVGTGFNTGWATSQFALSPVSINPPQLPRRRLPRPAAKELRDVFNW